MRLGQLVKQERERLGLEQKDLADLAGVTPPVVSRLEAGKRLGRIDTVLKVTGALGINPATVEALMQGRAEPLKVRERRTPYEIMRELEESLPILVPETTQPASAGPGVWAEAEAWPYYPSPDERRHQFVAVPVVGDCMVPRLHDGERVIVDKDASPRPGDIVVAIHDGETLIKQLEKRDDQVWLVALRDRKPIKVDETTRIIGVVRMVMHRP